MGERPRRTTNRYSIASNVIATPLTVVPRHEQGFDSVMAHLVVVQAIDYSIYQGTISIRDSMKAEGSRMDQAATVKREI
jgi:hypothetical protein